MVLPASNCTNFAIVFSNFNFGRFHKILPTRYPFKCDIDKNFAKFRQIFYVRFFTLSMKVNKISALIFFPKYASSTLVRALGQVIWQK